MFPQECPRRQCHKSVYNNVPQKCPKMSRQSLPKVFRWKCLMNFAQMFSNMFNRPILQPHPPRVFCKNVFHDLSFKCVLPSSFLFAYVSPQYTPFPRHKVLLLWMCKPYQHNAPPILSHSQYTFHKIRSITIYSIFIYLYIYIPGTGCSSILIWGMTIRVDEIHDVKIRPFVQKAIFSIFGVNHDLSLNHFSETFGATT